MSILSLESASAVSLLEAALVWLRRVPRAVWVIASAGVLALVGYQLYVALQSPAQVIRRDLVAAAGEARTLPWNRSPREVEAAIGRYFGDRPVNIDPRRFPADVTVTLPGVDRRTCREVRLRAGRIEGLVVVALEGYRSAGKCGARNDMTWHIMP